MTNKSKNRSTAILLCLFLGGAGAHKFYLNKAGIGVLYLLFCWTFIPVAFALIDFIIFLIQGEKGFNAKYNPQEL